MTKSSISEIFMLEVFRNFFEMHNFYIIWLCFPIYYMQNCVFLYLVLLLLHRIGNLLTYVAALLVASFWADFCWVAD